MPLVKSVVFGESFCRVPLVGAEARHVAKDSDVLAVDLELGQGLHTGHFVGACSSHRSAYDSL
jgi:hypothetical protein